jgi:hypothetical protein
MDTGGAAAGLPGASDASGELLMTLVTVPRPAPACDF